MYHVFEYEYETTDFRGSVPTLKEAYDLVQGDTAELYENSADDLTLKHVADFEEDDEDIDGDFSRAHRKRGWWFLEDNRFEVMEEYTERWVENKQSEFTTKDGKVISATGYFPQGQWVREE